MVEVRKSGVSYVVADLKVQEYLEKGYSVVPSAAEKKKTEKGKEKADA